MRGGGAAARKVAPLTREASHRRSLPRARLPDAPVVVERVAEGGLVRASGHPQKHPHGGLGVVDEDVGLSLGCGSLVHRARSEEARRIGGKLTSGGPSHAFSCTLSVGHRRSAPRPLAAPVSRTARLAPPPTGPPPRDAPRRPPSISIGTQGSDPTSRIRNTPPSTGGLRVASSIRRAAVKQRLPAPPLLAFRQAGVGVGGGCLRILGSGGVPRPGRSRRARLRNASYASARPSGGCLRRAGAAAHPL